MHRKAFQYMPSQIGEKKHVAYSDAAQQNTWPLSFAQQRLWFLEQYKPGKALYNIPVALEITGSLDINALQWSIRQTALRHEALRTTFLSKEGLAFQCVWDDVPAVLEMRQLPAPYSDSTDTEILEIAQREFQRPFDLAKGPLFRALLLRASENRSVLLFTIHHIVSDAWSWKVIAHDIGHYYTEYFCKPPTPLPELPLQYVDFACWQLESTTNNSHGKHLEYWRTELRGAPFFLDLPADLPRPSEQVHCGDEFSFQLPAELSQRLRAFCQRRRATVFMSMISVFGLLLCRYSGQTNFCVGYPVANRDRAETENIVGFFVNTLVLRFRIDLALPFSSLLDATRTSVLNAADYQDFPFEKLVEALNPERTTGHAPVIQVMFNHLTSGSQPLNLPGLKTRAIDVPSQGAKFDLAMSIIEDEGTLFAKLVFDKHLFLPSTIERMAKNYQYLLESVLSNPDAPIDRLESISPDERRWITRAWQRTGTAPAGQGVHAMFEQWAHKTPNAIAVTFEDDSISYADLNKRANKLAHFLRNLGAGPNTLVGICLPRSIELVVAVLAVFKAGAAYLPIEVGTPEDRSRHMLKEASSPIVLTDSTVKNIQASAPKIVCIDKDWKQISEKADTDLPPASSPNDLAYCIYTSGSTGSPKGVLVKNASVVNCIAVSSKRLGLDNRDCIPCLASLSFDIALFELLCALLNGGRSIVVAKNKSLDSIELIRLIEECTVIHMVPALMQQLVTIASSIGEAQRTRRLRMLLVGGDAVSAHLLACMRDVFRPAAIRVLYGPTEATMICAIYAVPPTGPVLGNAIGEPLENFQIQIVDAAGAALPLGARGELVISGAGVAAGYLNSPEQTRQKFARFGDAIFYRTGDIARGHADGNIEFMGRTDHQVKIRGYRIETGEIEASLLELDGVLDAVVLAVDQGNADGKRLAAFVKVDEASPVTIADLRLALGRKLPDYMIPATFSIGTTFPLNSNGKVDRTALASAVTTPTPRNETAPRVELTFWEARLAKLWEDLLHTNAFGVHDSFFDVGGNSILLMRYQAAIEREYGVGASIAVLFQHHTISALATHISKRDEVSPVDTATAQPPATGNHGSRKAKIAAALRRKQTLRAEKS
jgi:amino acid adenylation domain-containing protein